MVVVVNVVVVDVDGVVAVAVGVVIANGVVLVDCEVVVAAIIAYIVTREAGVQVIASGVIIGIRLIIPILLAT